MSADADSEILIEMSRIGGAMEVRAVSALDGLEVVFTAPASAARSDVEKLARSKLAFVRRREQGGRKEPPAGPDGKGGIVV